MNNEQISGHPILSLCVTLIMGIIASIVNNIELYVRLGAGLMAMVSGFMAVRHYYLQNPIKIKKK